MTHCRRPHWVLAVALALAAGALTRAEEPLPEKAKLRLGDTRMHFRFSPNFAPHPPDFKSLAFPAEGDAVALVGLDGTRAGNEKPRGAGRDLVLSADGKRYALVRVIDVTVHDTATGVSIEKFRRTPIPTPAVVADHVAVSLSADGKRLAWGGGAVTKDRGEVVVLDVDNNQVLFEAQTMHPFPAVGVLSPDGKLLATRGYVVSAVGAKQKVDETTPLVQVWDIAAKKELFRAKLTPAEILRIADVVFSPDGSMLAASFGNGIIDWWDVKTGQAKKPLKGQASQGQKLAFSPDGKTLAAVNTSTIERWATADGKALPPTAIPAPFPAHPPRGLRFADNDRVLAWGYVSSIATVWEAPAGKALTPFPSHTASIRSIAFAADGKEIVTSAIDGRTVRWDAATGKPLGPVTLKPVKPIPSRVLTLATDATWGITQHPPVLFNLKTGEEEFAFPRGDSPRDGVVRATSADRSKVAVVTLPVNRKDATICTVWDVSGKKMLGEVVIGTGHTSYPAVGLSPSGTRLVTAYQRVLAPDGVVLNKRPPLLITAWDVKTGKMLAQVEDVNVGDPAIGVAGESHAVVSTNEGRVRAYDYEFGRGGDVFEESQPRRETSAAPVVFSPERKRFAVGRTGEAPGTYGVRVYTWPEGTALHTFIGHASPVSTIAFSPDGKQLATGSEDATVLIWDMNPPPAK